ncbi:hypothetical protein ACF053_00415 [Streptomyces kanasensis]|uniref:hypothetical protein n=1 Tax=Streptomyces kanasensis TaxID=936756 RepID=UPI0036FB3BAD
MAYSSKYWWTELALFVSVSAASAFLLTTLWAESLDGREETVSGLLFIIPGLITGLWAARRFRRHRMASGSR